MAGTSLTGPLNIKKADGSKQEFIDENGVLSNEILKPDVAADTFVVTDKDTAATGNTALFLRLDKSGLDNNPSLVSDRDGAPVLWTSAGNESVVIPAESFVQQSISVNDDDNAASTGLAIYLHNVGGDVYIMKSVTANNANSFFEDASGNRWPVFDSNAAATDGLQLYFDEDGDDTGKFRAILPTVSGKVYDARGERFISITADASAASNGVAVFFDDDAAEEKERLLFVSPTNADGADLTVSPTSGQYVIALGALYSQVYYDEDGVNKLLHDNATVARDIYLPLASDANSFLKIAYSETASSLGVALYVDTGNAATARIEFVSPTNAHGSVSTDVTIRPFESIE